MRRERAAPVAWGLREPRSGSRMRVDATGSGPPWRRPAPRSGGAPMRRTPPLQRSTRRKAQPRRREAGAPGRRPSCRTPRRAHREPGDPPGAHGPRQRHGGRARLRLAFGRVPGRRADRRRGGGRRFPRPVARRSLGRSGGAQGRWGGSRSSSLRRLAPSRADGSPQ